MKTAIITLSAAILIAAAPAVLAKNVSSKAPHQHHQKRHPASIYGYAPWRVMHANGMMTGYPGAFGYAPGAPKDYTIDNSRSAGGCGGVKRHPELPPLRHAELPPSRVHDVG